MKLKDLKGKWQLVDSNKDGYKIFLNDQNDETPYVIVNKDDEVIVTDGVYLVWIESKTIDDELWYNQ